MTPGLYGPGETARALAAIDRSEPMHKPADGPVGCCCASQWPTQAQLDELPAIERRKQARNVLPGSRWDGATPLQLRTKSA